MPTDIEFNKTTPEPDPLLYVRSFWPQAMTNNKYAWRMVFFVRSAERVDRVFGNGWMRTEAPTGKVYATDLNLPACTRQIALSYFINNPPITTMGKYRTQLIARAMHNRGIVPCAIYCAPDLRCIQTAAAFATFFNMHICIEPGLIQFLNAKTISFNYHIEEFNNIYDIDMKYKPVLKWDNLKPDKSPLTGRWRVHEVIEHLTAHEREGPVIIVGHGQTLHAACEMAKFKETGTDGMCVQACTLEKKADSVMVEVNNIDLGLRYPPGSVVSLVQLNKKAPYAFRLCNNLIPSLSYGSTFCSTPITSEPVNKTK